MTQHDYSGLPAANAQRRELGPVTAALLGGTIGAAIGLVLPWVLG